jgi:hypothetical protein
LGFLFAPELHEHVREKAAHCDQTCKNGDCHEIASCGMLVGSSPLFVNHHSQMIVKKS